MVVVFAVDLNAMEPEIAARLESLCLSMTEHALGNIGQSPVRRLNARQSLERRTSQCASVA